MCGCGCGCGSGSGCVCVRGLRLVRVGGWGDDVSGVAGVLTELMDLAKGVD